MVYHGISPDYTPHIESGLALLGDSCKDVAVCRSTSLSSWAWEKKWRANCFAGEERLISTKITFKILINLMNTIDFNEQDVNIFVNDTWQKYAGSIGLLFKITLNHRLLLIGLITIMILTLYGVFGKQRLMWPPSQ
jgi:hypothetical protein